MKTVREGSLHSEVMRGGTPQRNEHVRKKVLFVSPCKQFFRSFMQWDLDILRTEFDVRLVHVCFNVHDLRGTFATPFHLIAGMAWADVVYSWFASFEAFWAVLLAKLYRKTTAVTVGGADVTTIPELSYGASLRPTKLFYSRFVLRNATALLPYSQDAERAAVQLLGNASRLSRIYLGVNTDAFHPAGTKRAMVLTVSIVNQTNIKRKGLETFVRAAAYIPTVHFVLAGAHVDDSIHYLRSIAPKNVKFVGFLAEQELLECYQAAQVYVQVAAHEAFGVALAEAMACECVPVVTERGAIPEVAGDTAIYVPYDDPEATAAGIQQAMQSDAGRAARQRIESLFALSKRKAALLRLIKRLLD